MRRIAFWLAGISFALILLAPAARSQENATITGTVTDPTGAVVPNVSIALTNQATGQVRQTVSNSAGIYLFANVGVGHFTLNATTQGFQKFTRTDIVVNTDQSLREDVSLTVGSEGQTVTVQANALQVQSETSELSTLISGQQVAQLATNGRNVTALAALGLGVSNNLPAFSGVNALTSANGISFNGTRTTHNIYLLDGGELNDRGCGGCFGSLPSIDALSEFQTLDSNYSPDYGIGSGGTILMVIKSGTRDFHGELYEFNRNEDYDANNYFTNLANQPRPEFRLNEPGGNIGGPLFIPHIYNNARKRTFFFVNEEWRRLIQGSTPSIVNTIMANNFPTAGQDLHYTVPGSNANPVVPTTTDPNKLSLYAADGLTPGQPFPGNVIPANLIDPNSVLEVNAGTFPRPNYGAAQFISSIPQTTNVREDVVRIDHTINSKLQLMGHLLHEPVTATFFPPLWGPGGDYPTVGTQMQNPAWSSVIKLTQTISPNLLNETSYLYSGNKITLSPITGPGGSFVQPSGWSATSFFPVSDNVGSRMPEIDLQGSPLNQTWTSSYFPWKNGYEGFEWRDDLSWTKGRHALKFGFSWLHDYKNQQLQANTQGTAAFNSSAFSGDSYINFLLGDATSFTQLQFLAGKHWVNNNYGFYANDNWHISSRLTLNLGIRFDGLPHAFERYNQFANFVPGDYNTSQGYPLNADGTLNSAFLTNFKGQGFYLNGIQQAGVGGFPRGNVQNKYNTWQPRIGFAYDLSGDGKTVVRGGFGLFYERVQGNDVYNAALNPPFAYQPAANNVYFSNPNTSALTGNTTSQTFPSVLTNLEYKYTPPGTAMFSLGVQHQLAPSVVLQVQYAGSLGWDQNDDRNINTLPLTDPNNAANPYDLRQGVSNGSLNANLYRIFPGFGGVTQEENETNFGYNALQAGLRMENKHGVTAQIAYTYSHEIDETSNDLGAISNPFNPGYDRGSGTLDRRHILNVNYIYAFPFFAHSSSVAARTVLSGWEFSGITTAETGVPQPLTYTGPIAGTTGLTDTLGLGGGTTNRPDLAGKVSYPKTRTAWFTPSAFANPVAPWNGGGNDGFGNAGKDAVRLPGLFNSNWSLFKTIPFTSGEGPNLELRFEYFNIFNHTEFNAIDANSGDANFGAVTNSYDARTLQLGAKLHF
ncbi:carboxypeptidase regulatory-like domain-containing protein [Paracidobacterium acidisoli]|uniref:TonB-dependent transporter Oar-like beta-barrel domain-containing protein n=1 Tax=Paracidobacterium acidisoli TaxID=2303751 RepID=A0A372IMP1_9BACT|nr:carboxypeptidase regulatory-like domain-containing protein [Paracidobacterium acidisoli]MBT9331768.1 carboxypeptidase regulatory-like domain-containing protein [Paracidobacterium acidisoli]